MPTAQHKAHYHSYIFLLSHSWVDHTQIVFQADTVQQLHPLTSQNRDIPKWVRGEEGGGGLSVRRREELDALKSPSEESGFDLCDVKTVSEVRSVM
jgi:hypothetical protein